MCVRRIRVPAKGSRTYRVPWHHRPPPRACQRGRLPRLVRACLTALTDSALPARAQGPLGSQPLPRVLELAASEAADFPAFDHAGADREALPGPYHDGVGPPHHCPHTADAVSSTTLPRATALPAFAPAALSIPRPSFAPSPQVRWNDATQTRLQPPVTIGNEEDPGFWKPFNSLAEYLIAGRGLSVSKVFDPNPNPNPNPTPSPNPITLTL
eukprot:scaffold39831_cov58-Phaeocystis_antarctica.AAC.2